jgi:hypothetical protein
MNYHLKIAAWTFACGGFDRAYGALADAGSGWRLAALGLAIACFVMMMRGMYMLGRKEVVEEFSQLAASKTDFSIVVTGSEVRFEPKAKEGS